MFFGITTLRNLNQQLGDDFTAAVQLANEEDLDASIIALNRIVDEGSDGYVTLAKMKKASILIQRGELELGLKIYLDLERNAVDQSFRDIASILYVLNSMDTEDPQVLLDKINKLESSQIWRSSALEMKAFLKLKQNKIEEARKVFESILNLPSTPIIISYKSKKYDRLPKGLNLRKSFSLKFLLSFFLLSSCELLDDEDETILPGKRERL